eukprot:TRINITY_DN1298_c0_g1_i2.p1 TRINITY_DN1298_c0_g1~~TRINITY_DN1298_c0_g1_i2.p1  ORF type:complete len:259 (-),score=36.07 TRINITY_DN1298_c0_g1_i2:239-1015(-)
MAMTGRSPHSSCACFNHVASCASSSSPRWPSSRSCAFPTSCGERQVESSSRFTLRVVPKEFILTSRFVPSLRRVADTSSPQKFSRPRSVIRGVASSPTENPCPEEPNLGADEAIDKPEPSPWLPVIAALLATAVALGPIAVDEAVAVQAKSGGRVGGSAFRSRPPPPPPPSRVVEHHSTIIVAPPPIIPVVPVFPPPVVIAPIPIFPSVIFPPPPPPIIAIPIAPPPPPPPTISIEITGGAAVVSPPPPGVVTTVVTP